MQKFPVTLAIRKVSSAPKSKRAKTNTADDAQILSLDIIIHTQQPTSAQWGHPGVGGGQHEGHRSRDIPQQGCTVSNAHGMQQQPFSSDQLQNKASGVSCQEGSVQSQQQQLFLMLAALAKDCTVQLLQVGGFTRYIVISATLYKAEVSGSSCNGVQAQHLNETLKAAITSVQKLSAHNVSVLAVDLQLSECCQSFHTICFSSQMNR